MKVYGVVLAGGESARMWPLARKEKPKHLLNLTGQGDLIVETVDRLGGFVVPENRLIVTNALQKKAIRTKLGGKILEDRMLVEPCARNTAACVGYAAMEIVKKYGDGIMMVLPADHYIANHSAFEATIRQAVSAATEQDRLVTIGVQPSYPATGYGYIRCEGGEQLQVRTVLAFKEKPDEEKAGEYLSSGQYLWNTGIYVWRAGLILEKFAQYAPDIAQKLQRIGDAMGTDQECGTIGAVYPSIRQISVDYAIMEPASQNGDVLVVPAAFGWSDLGTWNAMDVLHQPDADGNVTIGEQVLLNTKDCIAYSATGQTITAYGVQNLVIVVTKDAIMVCDRNQTQHVKDIVAELEKQGKIDLL